MELTIKPGEASHACGLALARTYEATRFAETDARLTEAVRALAKRYRLEFEAWLRLYSSIQDAETGVVYAWSKCEAAIMRTELKKFDYARPRKFQAARPETQARVLDAVEALKARRNYPNASRCRTPKGGAA